MRRITEKLSPGFDAHCTLDTWLEVDGTTVRVTLGCLPSGRASRHNCPAKPHAATDIVKAVAGGGGDAPLRILVTLASVDHAVALGTAIARAFPLYHNKSSKKGGGAANGGGEKPPRRVRWMSWACLLLLLLVERRSRRCPHTTNPHTQNDTDRWRWSST